MPTPSHVLQPPTGNGTNVLRCLPGNTPIGRRSAARQTGNLSASPSESPQASTPKSKSTPNSNASTPKSATPKSPVSEFLVYPAAVKKTRTLSGSARILTSIESRALLEEKERKKREEEEAKAQRKVDREEKKRAREEEKKQKLADREAKKAEQQRKKAEKEKALPRRKTCKKTAPSSNSEKGKEPAPSNNGESSGKRKLPPKPRKTYPKRRRVGESSGVRYEEAAQDSCSVCFGLYKDDLDEETGCIATDREWIQCSDQDCGVWSHVECLEESNGGFICALCQNVFM